MRWRKIRAGWFSIDLRREEIIKKLERVLEKEELMRGWRREQVIENVIYICENTFCTINNKVVNINEGLEIYNEPSHSGNNHEEMAEWENK